MCMCVCYNTLYLTYYYAVIKRNTDTYHNLNEPKKHYTKFKKKQDKISTGRVSADLQLMHATHIPFTRRPQVQILPHCLCA